MYNSKLGLITSLINLNLYDRSLMKNLIHENFHQEAKLYCN